jgi:hypothetical protein
MTAASQELHVHSNVDCNNRSTVIDLIGRTESDGHINTYYQVAEHGQR